MKTIISIDPGASGGLAVRDIQGKISIFKMPDTDGDVVSLLRGLLTSPPASNVAFMEDLIKHMGIGTPASTMAVYASNWGTIKGALMAFGVRLEIVRPQAWQKALGLGITGRQKSNTDGMTPEAAKAEKKRIQMINGQLKRDWKNKLKGAAQRFCPDLSEQITLATSDAVLILRYGIKTESQQLL